MLREEVSQRRDLAFCSRVFYAGDGDRIEERSDGAKEAHSSKTKVLVADDEQVIANTLTIILNRAGFEAFAVYNGEAVVEALNSFKPDVLISDVVMPGLNGIEAAIAVRSRRPNCKVLLFSGQAATADLLQEARAQGHSFEIIAKPVHPADLLAKLVSLTPMNAEMPKSISTNQRALHVPTSRSTQ